MIWETVRLSLRSIRRNVLRSFLTLLVADEPTGNLDTARTHEIMELLTQLNTELGLTIAMVTHEADVAGYAERTIRFLDGHVASDSSKLEVA